MHKFFCNYNPLTGKYELSQMRGGFRNSILIQAEVDLLDEINAVTSFNFVLSVSVGFSTSAIATLIILASRGLA